MWLSSASALHLPGSAFAILFDAVIVPHIQCGHLSSTHAVESFAFALKSNSIKCLTESEVNRIIRRSHYADASASHPRQRNS